MTFETIQPWLKLKITWHIFACSVGSVLALLAGAVVLFITFWLAYVMLFIGEWGISAVRQLCFNHSFSFGHHWRLILSGVFLVVLFIEWTRRSPWDLGKYEKVHSPPGTRALVYQSGGLGALGMLLANPQASASIITEILYSGPRLVIGAGTLAREAFRTRNLNQLACAQILLSLAVSKTAVTYEELDAERSDIEWETLKMDIARIPGIVILEKGLTLTDEQREEFYELAMQNPG